MASQALLELKIQFDGADKAERGLEGVAEKSSFLGNAFSTAMGMFSGAALVAGVAKVTSAVSGFLQGGIEDARGAAITFAQMGGNQRLTPFGTKFILDMMRSMNIGGAAPTINVNVAGNVSTERDLAEAIRLHLLEIGRRNGSALGGLA